MSKEDCVSPKGLRDKANSPWKPEELSDYIKRILEEHKNRNNSSGRRDDNPCEGQPICIKK